MRTFIAIEFPPTIQQQLENITRQLRSYLRTQNAPECLRWAGLHNVHLTLRFLGETTSAQAQLLAADLAEMTKRQEPFKLALGHVGGFPNLRQPRVLWLGVEGDIKQLNALQVVVEQCVQRAGFPAETRAFSPHITLARASRNAAKSDLRQIGQLVQTYSAPESLRELPPFQVSELVHMQSQLYRSGAVHTPLARFRFGVSLG